MAWATRRLGGIRPGLYRSARTLTHRLRLTLGEPHATSGIRHIPAHRQERLHRLNHDRPVHAHLGAESRCHPDLRRARLRVRSLHGQAPGFRWRHRILGLCPGLLHPHGGPGDRDPAYRAVPFHRHPHHASGDLRPHGRDHRSHVQRPLRSEHRVRLVQGRIPADGPVAGRRAL